MAFKMKGHTLPGINQKSEGNTDLKDGRSGSATFQMKSPMKDLKPGIEEGGIAHNTKKEATSKILTDDHEEKKHSAFKQTDDDLKEYLLNEKGFSQEDADRMMSDGAYDLDNSEFRAWYAESGKGDVDGDAVPMKKKKKKY